MVHGPVVCCADLNNAVNYLAVLCTQAEADYQEHQQGDNMFHRYLI
jgi:hypothetical protein